MRLLFEHPIGDNFRVIQNTEDLDGVNYILLRKKGWPTILFVNRDTHYHAESYTVVSTCSYMLSKEYLLNELRSYNKDGWTITGYDRLYFLIKYIKDGGGEDE